MANALSKITTRAKQIRKKKPNMKWSSAVKEASKEYRNGSRKISGVRKKKSGTARPRTVGGRITGVGDGTTLASSIAATKKKLEAELGWLLVNQRMATTKTKKREYGKRIADISKKLRALC